MRAFNDSSDVRHNKTRIVNLNNSQIRVNGREMIIRDFGLRAGCYRKQSGFSNIGKAYESDIRNQFHFQNDGTLFCETSGFRKIGSLAYRIFIMNISLSAFSSLGGHKRIAGFHQIFHNQTALFVNNHGSRRNFDNQVLSVLSEFFLFHAVLSVFGLVFPFISKIHQRAQAVVGHKDDIAALSSVSAVRTSLRNVRLPAKRYGSVSAFSRTDGYFRSIYKHDLSSVEKRLPLTQQSSKFN